MRVLISRRRRGRPDAGVLVAAARRHVGRRRTLEGEQDRWPRFDFAGTAYDASNWTGIVDTCARQIPANSVVWLDRDGRPFGRFKRKLIEQVTDRPYLGPTRYTLEEALIRAVEERVEIRYEHHNVLHASEGDRP